jgi:hypothetical protein
MTGKYNHKCQQNANKNDVLYARKKQVKIPAKFQQKCQQQFQQNANRNARKNVTNCHQTAVINTTIHGNKNVAINAGKNARKMTT